VAKLSTWRHVKLPRDRQTALDRVLAAALAAVEPGQVVRRALTRTRAGFSTPHAEYSRSDFRRLIVIGAGKASAPMASAVEDLIGDRLPIEGSVTVRYGHAAPTRHVRIREAGHPVPDAAGVEGTQAIVDLLENVQPDDLVVCVISGGGSALLTLPADGISLEDLRHTTDALLRSGAAINEINVVRKHLDVVKGGGLARFASPARLVTLVLSDVVGNPLDAIASGPTVADTSTFKEAAHVFDKYALWDRVPSPVSTRLRAGVAGDIPETPKPGDPLFVQAETVVVGSNLLACDAAARAAAKLGFNTLILTTYVEGEAREAGHVLAGVLREIDASGHPLARPACVIAGGETTVTIRGEGKGGRNQELALAAAYSLRGLQNVLLASIGTDGSDGPTDAAGAWVDGTTLDRAAELGLDPAAVLAANDSYTLLDACGNLIRTGPTHTNVNDLYLLFAF
jgi:glycerate 2-kinase